MKSKTLSILVAITAGLLMVTYGIKFLFEGILPEDVVEYGMVAGLIFISVDYLRLAFAKKEKKALGISKVLSVVLAIAVVFATGGAVQQAMTIGIPPDHLIVYAALVVFIFASWDYFQLAYEIKKKEGTDTMTRGDKG